MRILLRNRLTRLYFAKEGEWTEVRDLARTFSSSFEALKFVNEHALDDMEVVLTFGQLDLDLCIAAENIHAKPKQPPSQHPSR